MNMHNNINADTIIIMHIHTRIKINTNTHANIKTNITYAVDYLLTLLTLC